MSDISDALAGIERSFQQSAPGRIGIAVSGGSDSLALLYMMADWGKVPLVAATVDHGLRPEAAGEAEQVRSHCQALGIGHETLVWKDRDTSGNLQDRARRARYGLLADWAQRQDCQHVALGHTMDDVAETFVMRLARRSGVDGLAAMQAEFDHAGIRFHRPLLSQRRAVLQGYLRSRGLGWVDDPSNDDPGFERVRTRQALAAMRGLGLDAQALSAVAQNMARARDALEVQTDQAMQAIATRHAGDIALARPAFLALPAEIRRRVLLGAVGSISGADYGPRRQSVADTLAAIGRDEKVTIGGCVVMAHAGGIYITREFNAVRQTWCASDQLWDNRWLFDGRHAPGLSLRALGEAGIRCCPDWRATGRPRVAVLGDPGLWRDDTLIAAPTANLANGWDAKLVRNGKHAVSSALSH